MAKNVIITEDGHSKTISNATRIRTALEGGGTCDWIPKDDVPLQELTVTEDGVYGPEDGYYGFSQVTANGIGTVVEGTLIEKTVTKNGTYSIIDESGNPYGYSKITVNVDTSDDDSGGGSGGNNPVVGKDDDGNDTMVEADDDGNIVMTALPTEIKVIIPPTKLEYNRYEEVDYSGISVYAYISKAIHWLGTTTTTVTEGSSDNTVSIGGSNVTASVGDGVLYAPDRTGQNDVQFVWDGTKWVKPSNYSAEKAVWKSDKYPTGKIPFEELIFPIKRINDIESEKIVYTFDIDGILFKLVSVSSFSWSYDMYIGGTGEYLGRDFDTIYLYGSEYLGVIDLYDPGTRNSKVYVVSNTPNTKSIEYETTSYVSYAMDNIKHKTYPKVTYTTVHQISVDNINSAHNNRSCSVNIPVTNIPYGKTSNDILNNIINRYNSDDYKKTESISIPVQWKRPGDGKILETTFTAWMTDEGGDNNTSGSTTPGSQNIDVPQ